MTVKLKTLLVRVTLVVLLLLAAAIAAAVATGTAGRGRTGCPHFGHVVSGASEACCITSKPAPQRRQGASMGS